ncbi:hypothetical protein Hypma_008512 [Hypsizygus marmoreus]|uniref:Uncharacterized protein n=1 Tax=Hypsizygus marmoreus TaxID=39966 RepID=A0A369JQD0_HYPMA|nr:hypothetical protein Hypma_008512 [Hypsizygus marmoreus]
MVQKNIALAVAALAIGVGSSAAAPLTPMVTRDSEAALYGRADKIVRAGVKVADAVLTDKMKNKVKGNRSPNAVPAGLVDAAKKVTGPHDPVSAATNPKPPKKKGRSLDFNLEDRDFEEELYAPRDKIVKAGVKVREAVLTDKMKNKVKEYTQVPHPSLSGLVDAAKKATGPHDPALVRAATNPKPPKKKGRSLDFDLEERDFFDEEELYARADKIVKVASRSPKLSSLKMKNKVKEYTKVPTPVPAGLVDAAKKATGPHDPALVRAATNPKPPKKKGRSLDFDLDERDFFDEEELYARADKVIKGGVKVADAILTDKMKNKVKEYTKVPTPVPAGLVDAAKKATGPHDPALTTPKKKGRSLDFDLEERDFFDEEELYARADKIVADAILTDKMKNKVKEYTKVPTPVPAGLVDAAKKATKPHDPALVRAATNPLKKKGRSLDLEDILEARWWLELEDLD